MLNIENVSLETISPGVNWPNNINTIVTTRNNGYSKLPFNSLNLATHVNDNKEDVRKNREIINKYLPDKPFYLEQTHSNYVLDIDSLSSKWDITNNHNYDASFTRLKNKVCTIMVADCIPILLTDKKSSFVAAIHAGWRGVENGIIKNTISALNHTNLTDILVYIGPSICQDHFEVGIDVKQQFINLNESNQEFFIQNPNHLDKFNCDLTAIAINQMIGFGISKNNILQSNLCTYCDTSKFFSFRRDGDTGRIAAFIWIS